jgi:hypothetical protein
MRRVNSPIPLILASAFTALFCLALGCAVGAITLGGGQ